ncbi:MAG TPA: hypothetical protein VKU41_00220 [Polyangiaceae bacterium]|nr:hypothetical protein [Polyangiaceae bacterium]
MTSIWAPYGPSGIMVPVGVVKDEQAFVSADTQFARATPPSADVIGVPPSPEDAALPVLALPVLAEPLPPLVGPPVVEDPVLDAPDPSRPPLVALPVPPPPPTLLSPELPAPFPTALPVDPPPVGLVPEPPQ